MRLDYPSFMQIKSIYNEKFLLRLEKEIIDLPTGCCIYAYKGRPQRNRPHMHVGSKQVWVIHILWILHYGYKPKQLNHYCDMTSLYYALR